MDKYQHEHLKVVGLVRQLIQDSGVFLTRTEALIHKHFVVGDRNRNLWAARKSCLFKSAVLSLS